MAKFKTWKKPYTMAYKYDKSLQKLFPAAKIPAGTIVNLFEASLIIGNHPRKMMVMKGTNKFIHPADIIDVAKEEHANFGGGAAAKNWVMDNKSMLMYGAGGAVVGLGIGKLLGVGSTVFAISLGALGAYVGNGMDASPASKEKKSNASGSVRKCGNMEKKMSKMFGVPKCGNTSSSRTVICHDIECCRKNPGATTSGGVSCYGL